MTTEQYRIVAAHIARHCMNHLQFVYDSDFEFEDLTLSGYATGPDVDFG